MSALTRQLAIKTGVVRRLTKEEKTYEAEAEEQAERVRRFEAEGRDEWDVRKQKEVHEDCLKMIPDCRKRLEAATEDLGTLLESLDEQVRKSDEAKAAKQAYEDAQASIAA